MHHAGESPGAMDAHIDSALLLESLAGSLAIAGLRLSAQSLAHRVEAGVTPSFTSRRASAPRDTVGRGKHGRQCNQQSGRATQVERRQAPLRRPNAHDLSFLLLTATC
jgi:hypothetical protein